MRSSITCVFMVIRVAPQAKKSVPKTQRADLLATDEHGLTRFSSPAALHALGFAALLAKNMHE